MTKITYCCLPFGTGNDTGSVFGWGCKIILCVILIIFIVLPGPYAENVDTLINALIWAYKDTLTIWEVHFDGEVYNPFDERLE